MPAVFEPARAPAEGALNAPEQAQGATAIPVNTAPPPATDFRLVRYFTAASLVAFLLFAAALYFFEREEGVLYKQLQKDNLLYFRQAQDAFARQYEEAARGALLSVREAGNANLGRLFSNTLWEQDFAPFVARVARIPVDRCRAIAEVEDASGKKLPPGEKQACFAGVGKQIMALPEFRAIDAKVFETMKKSTVHKIKIYDPRGITAYSSEHGQIGEDKLGNTAWESAMAGKLASQLIFRGQFTAFEGTIENRDLVSTYMPVYRPRSEKIVGVIEVYSDVTPFLEQIKNTSLQIRKLREEYQAQAERETTTKQQVVEHNTDLLLAGIFGTLVLLYLVLFLIVRNAQRLIDRQGVESRQAALALSRKKDLYDVLSQTNQAIVRLVGRDELFAIVCRIAVEHGRFPFAWIGLIDKDDQRLKRVASYGKDAGYMNDLEVSADGAGASSRGLIGRMLLSGTHVVSNDFLNDPATAPWHEMARRAGVRASAKFPIRQGGAVAGAINLYAGEPGFFTEDVLATLDEMANDVSFALDNFERESERAQAIEVLREGEARYRELFESNPHPMWVDDLETLRFLAVNDAAVAHYGYTRDEFLAMSTIDIHAPEDVPRLRETIARRTNAGIVMAGIWRHRKKVGTLIDVEITSHALQFSGRRALVVLAHDITERKRAEESLLAAEGQFRGLVEQSIAGIFIIQDGKLAYLNPRFAEVLGYGSTDELIGRELLSLTAEENRPAEEDKIRKLLAGGSHSISDNSTARRKDGLTVEIGWCASRAHYRGRPAIIGLMQDISEKKRAEEQINRYVAQLQNAFMRTVEVATTIGEMRDPYTAGHERRVAAIAVAIGAELGFDARRAEGLRVAGYLHDVGKITIPSEILSKPGKLSAAEFQLIKGHAQASYDVLKSVEFPWPVAEIALQHHERLDGSGYPRGLKGDAILLEARILAVADTIEAMSSHRPYRPGLGIEKALAEIERGRGTVYDPDVADACLRLFRENAYVIPI